MPLYPQKLIQVMGAFPAPTRFIDKYKLGLPDFEYIGKVRAPAGYRKGILMENRHIKQWMEEECMDTGGYTYTKGDIETSYNAINKYKLQPTIFEPEAFSKAWQMVAQSWSIVPKSAFGWEYTDWLDMTTSPGYPFSLLYSDKRKCLQDNEMVAYIDSCVSQDLASGLWTIRCKKEPTKQTKVDAHNTRIIVSSPIEVQAFGAKLFGPMNNHIYQSARQYKIPCTVGCTKYYRGWHTLYQRLTRSGTFTHGLELDYTNFDGSCTLEEFEQVMNIRFGMLNRALQTPQTKEAFRRYYSEMIYTKMVTSNGEVLMKRTGNPSGQVNTIIDNSIINEFRWYYAWCSIVPEHLHNLSSFRDHCELITCGDDSLLSASKEAQTFFPPQQIFNLFKEHCWAPKFGLEGWQPIHTLHYCSQSFRWLNGFVVPAPSNYQKMCSSLLYGGAKRDARETLGRLLGVKTECYFLPNFRSSLDRIISKLFERYYLALQTQPSEDEFTYSELCILNRDYASMYGLYLGFPEDTVPHVGRGFVPYFTDDHLNDPL